MGGRAKKKAMLKKDRAWFERKVVELEKLPPDRQEQLRRHLEGEPEREQVTARSRGSLLAREEILGDHQQSAEDISSDCGDSGYQHRVRKADYREAIEEKQRRHDHNPEAGQHKEGTRVGIRESGVGDIAAGVAARPGVEDPRPRFPNPSASRRTPARVCVEPRTGETVSVRRRGPWRSGGRCHGPGGHWN